MLKHRGRHFVDCFDVPGDQPEVLFVQLDIRVGDVAFQDLIGFVVAVGIQDKQGNHHHDEQKNHLLLDVQVGERVSESVAWFQWLCTSGNSNIAIIKTGKDARFYEHRGGFSDSRTRWAWSRLIS